MIDGESKDGNCDEMMCAGEEANEQDNVDGMKKGTDFTGKVMHIKRAALDPHFLFGGSPASADQW